MSDPTFLPASLFQGEEHHPFFLNGNRPAVLLVHGFPGTPAEMRSLAGALNVQGWSVEGMLLPGFGPQIHQLPEKTAEDWISAASERLGDLAQRHKPLVVGGFSMGAAIAMIISTRVEVDGVILVSPYWRLANPLWHFIPVLSRLFKQIKPFQLAKIDPGQPEVRAGIQEFMPGLDLENPQVVQGLRQFTIPTSIFVELRQVGLTAKRSASRLSADTLVLQGRDDQLVQVQMTRRLLQEIPARIHYHEFQAGHDLIDPGRPAWAAMILAVTNFLNAVAGKL